MLTNKFILIESLDQVNTLIKYIQKTGYASIDFETNGEQINSDNFFPTILGFSFQPGVTYILPLGHKEAPKWLRKGWVEVLHMFNEPVFKNPKVTKVAWNLKFEQKILMRYGITLEGRLFDAMLAKYMLDETRPNDLKSIVRRFIPDFSDYEDKVEFIANKVGWANVDLNTLSEYCALDCDLTLRLMNFFEPKLIKAGLYKLFRNLLMSASGVLARSEYRGYSINEELLDSLIIKYRQMIDENEVELRKNKVLVRFEKKQKKERIENAIAEIQEEIDKIEEEGKPNAAKLISAREEKISRMIAGNMQNNKEKALMEPFNFSSPKQVKELFFTKKGFGFTPIKFTGSGEASTDEETLLKLKPYDGYGFIEKLLRSRELEKLYSTYLVGIKDKLVKGKLHATYLIHGTVSGRLSCLSGDSIINTEKGFKKLKELCPTEKGFKKLKNTKVLTHTGNYQRAVIGINQGIKEIYRVELESGEVLECTLDHRLLTNKGWKELKDIYDTNGTINKGIEIITWNQ